MNQVKRVFISYAREDKEIARQIFRDLRQVGAEPWLDEESLLPGQRWKTATSTAIRESDFFLALLSSNSVSKRGYVQKELREALELLDQVPDDQIYVIPVRLNDCKPTHEKLLELNWVDLFPEYESGLRRILLVVRPKQAASTGQLRSVVISDRSDLEETGWAVVFSDECKPEVKEALMPLLELRKAQAGNRYKELVFNHGDTKERFLTRYGVGPGPADPIRTPYYLLLIGSPEVIPFSVQYQLGVQYRVGRLDFETPEQYRNYAHSAVDAEKVFASRISIFFGAKHPGDRLTNLAVSRLVEPLADYVTQSKKGWEIRLLLGPEATKERLRAELQATTRAAVWLIVSHGLAFPPDHPRQIRNQGAIVCSDWMGADNLLEVSVVSVRMTWLPIWIFAEVLSSTLVPIRQERHATGTPTIRRLKI